MHIKWVIKMIDQFQVALEEAQFKQVALWETYVLQLAHKKWQIPDIDEISIIYLYMEKNGIEILLSLTICIFFQIAIDIIRNDEDPKV